MQISTAPIIHARTRDVDFRANFLVAPTPFSASDILWCRNYITESTRYFETVRKDGRRVFFCNDDFVIIGISITIQNLFDLCQVPPKYHLVDGNRTNYGFIGFAFPRSEVKFPFEIPYSMFLAQYQKYMDLRWNDSGNSNDSLLATKVPFVQMNFPEAKSISTLLNKVSLDSKVTFNIADATQDEIIAEILSKLTPGFYPAFCSDLPNATSFIDSHFNLGTSSQYAIINKQILASIESTQKVDATIEATIEDDFVFVSQQSRPFSPRQNLIENSLSQNQTHPYAATKEIKRADPVHESTFSQLQRLVGNIESDQEPDENLLYLSKEKRKEKLYQKLSGKTPSFGSRFKKTKNDDIDESSETPFSSYGYFKK